MRGSDESGDEIAGDDEKWQKINRNLHARGARIMRRRGSGWRALWKNERLEKVVGCLVLRNLGEIFNV